jgi:hypothetical protein
MDLKFDLIFIPTSKRFRASGFTCQHGGIRVLNPYVKLHKIRCRFKKYLTAEIAEYAEII